MNTESVIKTIYRAADLRGAGWTRAEDDGDAILVTVRFDGRIVTLRVGPRVDGARAWSVTAGGNHTIHSGRALSTLLAYAAIVRALESEGSTWHEDLEHIDPFCPLTSSEEIDQLLLGAPTEYWRGYLQAVRDHRVQLAACMGHSF